LQLRKYQQYRGLGGDAGHLFHKNDTKNIRHPYARKINLSISRFSFAVSQLIPIIAPSSVQDRPFICADSFRRRDFRFP